MSQHVYTDHFSSKVLPRSEQTGIAPPPEALKPFPQGIAVGPPIGKRSADA
jgi:hypothetical protein